MVPCRKLRESFNSLQKRLHERYILKSWRVKYDFTYQNAIKTANPSFFIFLKGLELSGFWKKYKTKI